MSVVTRDHNRRYYHFCIFLVIIFDPLSRIKYTFNRLIALPPLFRVELRTLIQSIWLAIFDLGTVNYLKLKTIQLKSLPSLSAIEWFVISKPF